MIYNNLVLSLQRATTIRKEILAREMAHSNRFTGTWTSTCQWISVSLHCKNSMQKCPEARERLYLPTHGSDYFEIGSAKQVATAGARTEERRRASWRVRPVSSISPNICYETRPSLSGNQRRLHNIFLENQMTNHTQATAVQQASDTTQQQLHDGQLTRNVHIVSITPF